MAPTTTQPTLLAPKAKSNKPKPKTINILPQQKATTKQSTFTHNKKELLQHKFNHIFFIMNGQKFCPFIITLHKILKVCSARAVRLPDGRNAISYTISPNLEYNQLAVYPLAMQKSASFCTTLFALR